MRILVVDPYMPLYDCSSGHRRLLELLRILVAGRNEVSFVACEGRNQERYANALKLMGTDVYCGNPDIAINPGNLVLEKTPGTNTDLATLLLAGSYDIVILSYFHTAELYLNSVRRLSPHSKIFIDTVDVHFVREQREAELYEDIDLFRQAAETRRREIDIYSKADVLITVTQEDRSALLRELPSAHIHILPNIHRVSHDVPAWAERDGLFFVGNFYHRPNKDAVRFLCREIMPRIWMAMPAISLTIAGYALPDELRKLAEERIFFAGHVPDTAPYLRSHRISVAPLRFGAGLKGKVGEALAAGVPVVTTPIGAEGIPLQENPDYLLVAGDAESFAEAVVRLYQDEILWNHMSVEGRKFVWQHYSPQRAESLMAVVFSANSGETSKAPVESRLQVEG
jgi:O-antigen biosynthesis protein